MRVSTLILLVVILALVMALLVQDRRARDREARLRSTLLTNQQRERAAILAKLDQPFREQVPFFSNMVLMSVVHQVRMQTRDSTLNQGIPLTVDYDGLSASQAMARMRTPIAVDFSVTEIPLKESLRRMLAPTGLDYYVAPDGRVIITAATTAAARQAGGR